jgi:DNA-binding IclR family transcriptional regulator
MTDRCAKSAYYPPAGLGEELDKYSFSSVDKALAILNAFTPRRQQMGVSEVARRTHLPKSTAHRLLAVLVSWGLIDRDGTLYSPGQKLAELASLTRPRQLRDVALPYMQDLFELTHNTINLAILDNTEVFYVEQIFGHKRAKSPACVGARMPANCTAIGKVMLAYQPQTMEQYRSKPLPRLTSNSIGELRQLRAALSQIRDTGVAYDRQEAAVGLTCVAAPIIAPGVDLVGAISIAGPARTFISTPVTFAIRTAAVSIAHAYSQFLVSTHQHATIVRT